MGNICSISIPLDPLVSGCWSCISAEANYIRKLENNFHALETELENLTDLKNNVKRRVRVAEQQQRATLEAVQRWILRVEVAEVDINEVIKDGAQEIEKLCFGGCCSKNCRCIYKFGKKVAQKLEFVASLHREGDFKDVADTAASASVDLRPSEPTVVEDTESTFDKVWKCLEQNEVRAVGVYGVGGVGKTTLLTKINNQFDKTPIGFDFVIWVTVSKDLNLDKVQDDIWERIVGVLDDGWKQKNRSRKADAISKFLSQKKFVLLLDDIWEQVDLKEVGIPLQKNADEYKLVFTTRSKEVCGLMGAKMIEVKCLSREKAWELFEKKVGDNDALCNPKIRQLAEKVAEECDGLPLALITTGSAMASKKTIEEWERDLDILKNSASKFSGMEKVFARLKFSYDNLQNDRYKSCFLYCALFPEDCVIDKTLLIDYWIGEGFLDEFDDLNRTRTEGHHIIGTLFNACLLEDEEGNIKMHDVIRDMALWIVSENEKEKKNYFLVKAGAGLAKAPKIQKWEGAIKISLMRNKIEKLTGTPSCSNLTTLFLSSNRLAEISDGVFDQMPNLLVLDLSMNEIKEVPLGISRLVLLQYLNLSYTRISQLPIELRSLVNLKYLNLEGVRFLDLIPKDLISCFSKLQVFILNNSGGLHKDFLSNKGFIWELESLQDLEDFRVDIRNVTSLQRFSLSKKLQRCTRHLSIVFIYHLQSLNVSSLKSLTSLHTFVIRKLNQLAEVEIDWAWAQRDEIQAAADIHLSIIRSESIFHSLRYVYVLSCYHLTELTWLVFAPNIIYLWLSSCHNMKEVMSVKKLDKFLNGAENLNPFSSLETLSLGYLYNLESIYPNALSFPCLKKVTVRYCPQLKRLPLNSESAKKGCNITIEGSKQWWDNLHWEDEATLDTFLPSFKEKKS